MPNIIPPSLEKPQTAAKLRALWLMDERQRAEIGGRLRDLRDASPETNRSIADYVDVSERTVAAWAGAEQGMTYAHAQKVAKLFEVEIDWLWRGRDKGTTPDIIGELSERLDRIERGVEQTLALLAEREAESAPGISRAKPRRRRANGADN